MNFSFEIFPPKTDKGFERLCSDGGVLDQLNELNPAYISVTYGAGGTDIGRNMAVLKKIAQGKCSLPVTHYTCINNSVEGVREEFDSFLENGISHVLALRGDIPKGQPDTGGAFQHSSELVRFLKNEYGSRIHIAVAGLPEGHIESTNFRQDIRFLKMKQEEGAERIITQLCWDMEQFKRWYDLIRREGITMPVDIGVMPVLDPAVTIRMALSNNGCAIPSDLARIISRHWLRPHVFAPEEDQETMDRRLREFRAEGMAYTIRQCREYKKLGPAGIHLYVLNKADVARKILREV